MEEHLRWTRRKKKKQLKEYSTPVIDHNMIKRGKQYWKQFQHAQDKLRMMFPGLVKKDNKGDKERYEEIRPVKRDTQEYRYDNY